MLPKDGKMHFSNLKHFAKSPLHYALSCDAISEDSKAFRIGRAVHAWVLQGIHPVVFHGVVRRGKEWDTFYTNAMIESNASKDDILSTEEYEQVVGCVSAVKANKTAMDYLELCDKREDYLEWDRDGVPCAGRIDAYGKETLVELKTCACASPRKFLYDAHKFSYHAQMAWYDIALGTEYTTGETAWRDHIIIAVESSAPFSCVVFKLDDLRIDQGHALCEEWIAKYHECAESGIYPSYAIDQPITWDGEIIIQDPDEDETA